MRTNALLTALVTAAFLATAAGAALAQGGGPPDASEREARLAALHAARNASLASFHENRTAALADYHAANNATKASFLENKTRVLGECEALRNSTEGSNHSKCVHDGLKPLIEKARAEHAAHRDALKERLLDARENAKASFAAARAQHGPRGSG